MATTTRQSTLLVNQDWTKLYQAFREADFQSYDFQTLRKAMIDYLRTYYTEDFNDFLESSEYVALIDLIAFLGQSLAFRTDLNARENFIDTAERRDSVLKLAKLISYNPKRNTTSSGFLKVTSVSTTETLYDNDGINLSNLVVKWNDNTNGNWSEQFNTIINAALPGNQVIGRPSGKKNIGNIQHEEYQISLVPGTIPVYKFDAAVENTNLPFEIVSATTIGQQYVYEVPPRPTSSLGFLYKNDNLGNGSVNTGFFLFFKQGSLKSQDFALPDSLPNRVVNINRDNINNTDVWLYSVDSNNLISAEWNKLPAVNGVNIIYNNAASRNSFQVNSRSGDQIDLVFGDGTFTTVPQGSFRCYYRQSSGLTYKITPDEMQNITVPISYLSKTGRVETLTMSVSLQYTVANAVARETLDEIRTKAPQQYYTQNRMVTAEDYNIFPYTNFSSVSKVKAINRSSSGISRYLDVVDVTGKYSSTNIFADDGILYESDGSVSFEFVWNTLSEITQIIKNQISPIVRSQELQQFYYKNFESYPITNTYWKMVTVGSGNSTGYFVNAAGNTLQVGAGVSSNAKFIVPGALLKIVPPAGKYFDSLNEIKLIPASGVVPAGGSLALYSGISRVVGGGSTGVLSDGTGAVILTNSIPTGSVVSMVYPAFNNDFTNDFISAMIEQIRAYRDFGIGFDQESGTWYIVSHQNLDLTSDFSTLFAGDTTGLNRDSSWVCSFTVSGTIYTASARGVSYIFESLAQTKFYYDNAVKVFDPKTGLTINDNIKVLRVNGDQSTGVPYNQDIPWFVYKQVEESDGYVDNSKIMVTFSDSDNDGVPDNPEIFNIVVSDPNSFVFFEKTYTYRNFVKLVPVSTGVIDADYATVENMLPHINEYSVGQVWYMYDEDKFYVSYLGENNIRYATETTNYVAKVGRSGLYFQYRHNSPNYRRIDPSPNAIIDIYFLTKAYETDYRTWVLDTSGKVNKPEAPTSEELRIQFAELENYKSVTDAIVYNAAKFKPLFGSKAAPELQATFKVIKNPALNLSDSEIRAQVLATINAYFQTTNWEFGDTFYFSELSAYIHSKLATLVSSVIIVPNDASLVYGALQQITAAPDEILISAATVDNIEVISTITAAQLGY